MSTAGDAAISNIGGVMQFSNSSTAGAAMIINNGGVTQFLNTSTAANSTITTNFGGETVFSDTSTELQVAGANPGQYDTLNVGGNAGLGGTLQLVSLGFRPRAGNQLTLITTGGVVSNRFAKFVDPFTTGPGYNSITRVWSGSSFLLKLRAEYFTSVELQTSSRFRRSLASTLQSHIVSPRLSPLPKSFSSSWSSSSSVIG